VSMLILRNRVWLTGMPNSLRKSKELVLEMRTEIRLAGFGGQGLVLAGMVLARAAVMYAGIEAVQRQSYGTEARGGASRSEVIISDQVIDYPGVVSGRNDVLVAMGGAALTRYLKDVKPGGMVIYDPDLISDVPKDVDAKFYGIRAARMLTPNSMEFGQRQLLNDWGEGL